LVKHRFFGVQNAGRLDQLCERTNRQINPGTGFRAGIAENPSRAK
jgi:hypothetical protein